MAMPEWMTPSEKREIRKEALRAAAKVSQGKGTSPLIPGELELELAERFYQWVLTGKTGEADETDD